MSHPDTGETGETYDVEQIPFETTGDVSSLFRVCQYCQSLLFGEERQANEHIDSCRKISLRIRR